MTDFIEITDTKGETFMLNKKHILKVDTVKNDKDGLLTRITLDIPDSQRDFALLFTKELYADIVKKL